MPLRLLHWLAHVLGWLMLLLPNKRRAIARANLQLCFPEQDAAARRQLLRANAWQTACALLELGRHWTLSPEQLARDVVETRGEDAVRAAQAAGQGVIFAGPHLGAWELLGLWLSMRYPLTSMYKPQVPGWDDFIRAARERAGAKLVPSEHSGVRAQLAALRKGETIGILPDQDPGYAAGVFAPFFGVKANTAVLLPRLARKADAAVFFCFAERLPRARGYRLHFVPAPDGLKAADAAEAAAAVNAGVEACIKLAPAQYWWSYPRFRRRPGRRRIQYWKESPEQWKDADF